MRSLTPSRVLLACLCALSVLPGHSEAAQEDAAQEAPSSSRVGDVPATAFFYGEALPLDELSHFGRIVVDPDRATRDEVAALQRAGSEVFAYVSIGEVDWHRAWLKHVDRAWLLGSNPGWGSDVVDPTAAGWRTLLLERMDALWAQGYRAFFWDTLDSYERFIGTALDRRSRIDALARLTEEVHRRHPGVKLFFNRGFDVIPKVAPLVHAVAVESLFRGWSSKRRAYEAVTEPDRRWLLRQLHLISARHIPVVVIDYVAAGERTLARATAAKIDALGFTPWVTTPALDTLGIGAVEVVPRKVLIVFDSVESSLPSSAAHRLLAPALEYLGYFPEYVDVRESLPTRALFGQYAGIVTWFSDDELGRYEPFRKWLLEQLDGGMQVAILGRLGFPADPGIMDRLGLEQIERPMRSPLRIRQETGLIGFEAPAEPVAREIVQWRPRRKDVTDQVIVEDGDGQRATLVGITPWGGFAFDPLLIETDHDGHQRWILNPFEFVRLALRLPAMPIPDVTTGNGSRLLTVHIDGDGFASRAELPGRPFAGQLILDRILRKYQLPTTVSVIEAELSLLHPESTAVLEGIARRIFVLPHVELASHSFSHPFNWERNEKSSDAGSGGDENHLAVPGYHFDLEREVRGSVDYINRRLAPEQKRVRVFLWTGNALPSANALALTHALGLFDLNGGQSMISKENRSLTELTGIGRPVGSWFQIYAPIGNENLYTNLWRGPFYGFRRVIETFQLTDEPLRLKPISIYYHFYSGTKQAALVALDEVYAWANAQEPLALWVSEYAQKAQEFRTATIARRLDGGWQLHGFHALRTVRVPATSGWPMFERCRGVAGVRDLAQGRYVALSGEPSALLQLGAETPSVPYLMTANAEIVHWERTDAAGGHELALRLRGHQALRFAIGGAHDGCTLRAQGRKHAGTWRDGAYRFELPADDTGEASLVCH